MLELLEGRAVERVTGATAAGVVALEAAPEPDEPELVMLNWLDWARMALPPWGLGWVLTRLIWKAVPTGHAPLGKVTWAVF